MGRRTSIVAAALIALAAALSGCGGRSEDRLLAEARAIFGALPEAARESDSQELVDLGRMLYFDTVLSANGMQSCNSCHPVDGRGPGSDNIPVSPGTFGDPGTRNSPTVINSAFHRGQFWDGRVATLEEQAKIPILNPIEMAMPDEQSVVRRLRGLSHYRAAFARTFPGDAEPVSFDNVAAAIAAFERTLVSRDRFDRYLGGDSDALTPAEKKGLAAFIDAGCMSCHRGPAIGGTLYQKLGVRHPYPGIEDLGRFQVTQAERDRHVFKVASLRNVLVTAPYGHNGRYATVGEAIDAMAWHQLSTRLSSGQIESIIRFFAALTDERIAGSKGPRVSAGEESFDDAGALVGEGREIAGRPWAAIAGEGRGNALACLSCHQELGTWSGGGALIRRGIEPSGVRAAINECVVRNMDGEPLGEGDSSLPALEAWVRWAAANRERPTVAKLNVPAWNPDPVAGAEIYRVHCQGCHGSDGEGYRAASEGESGRWIIPPVAGSKSFGRRSHLSDPATLASYIHATMPLGTTPGDPVLSEEEAWDVAAHVLSLDRPAR
jgi:cytochrome c peroxidase